MGGRGSSAARPSCCGTATRTRARRRRGRRARRLRPRRLPAHRRHRPLLAGDGRGRRASPPPAVRSSASATASRCSPRPGCSRARCRRTPGSRSCATPSSSRWRRTRSVLTSLAEPGARAAHPDQPLRGQLRVRRRHAARAPRRRPRRRPLRRQPQRQPRRHRRHQQRGRQRRRAHAAPRAGAATRCSAQRRRRGAAAVAARRRPSVDARERRATKLG